MHSLVAAAASLLLAAAALAGPPPVTAIYPSGDRLPANHLKFYIYFSEPMQQGVFLEHCRLLNEQQRPVPEPFRETELWSADGRRLTLWLHPGRQKTGVNLNAEFGPILEPQGRYTLIISGKWPRENGETLGRDVEKTFRTGGRLAGRLDTAVWQVVSPPAESSRPLTIHFPSPLDHALLLRCLRVVNAAGQSVAGTVGTMNYERTWTFTPNQPWTPARHKVVVDSFLEDLGGNSLARPFEVDLQAVAPPPVPRIIAVPFQPEAANDSQP